MQNVNRWMLCPTSWNEPKFGVGTKLPGRFGHPPTRDSSNSIGTLPGLLAYKPLFDLPNHPLLSCTLSFLDIESNAIEFKMNCTDL